MAALRIVAETEISPVLDAAIRASLCTCFAPDREVYTHTRAWHGTFPTWSVVMEHGEAVIAHAGIVEREIRAGTTPIRVAGVQNVLVLPEFRGQGLFRQVMCAAMEEARRRGLDLGLLFCTPEIGRKYTRLGWLLLTGRQVTRIDEHGRAQPLPAKNVTMFYGLRLEAVPPGDLHLQGNDW